MRKLVLFLLIIPHSVSAQIITTYAGNGIGGPSPIDGGPATNAQISRPYGLNLDNTGNLLICQDDLVRKIDKMTNIINTIAGSDTASSLGHGGDGGPATCANLIEPYGICIDNAGNYYIADRWYSEVRKVDVTTGIIDTFAGNRNPGNAGDGGLAKSAELENPFTVCFDATQHYLYISEEFGNKIRRVDMSNDTIGTFAGTGINGYAGDESLAVSAEFGHIMGMCFDHLGNLYVGDWGNKRIRKINAVTGIITTICGNGISGFSGDNGPATNAMITQPFGICFDKCDNLYFSDSNRVRRIDGITNIITTIAGNGTAGFSGDNGLAVNAQLNVATGVAIDSFGNLYIGDQQNNRVRKVTIFNPYLSIVSSTNGLPVCSGYPITIQATWAGGGDTPSFQWVVNSSVVATTATGSYTYIPTNGDFVSCILTSSSACVGTPTVVSNMLYISTDTLTVPAISVSAISLAATGALVTLTATVTNAGSSYNIKWFNNGLLFSTTTTPTVTYTKATGTDNITARVIPVPVGTIPGCYDTTTSAVHTITDTGTAVITVTAQHLHIYPNPVSDVIHIDGVTGQASYRLLSIVGAVLQRGNLQEQNSTLPMQSLSKGVYILEVRNSEQRTITKIVKQ